VDELQGKVSSVHPIDTTKERLDRLEKNVEELFGYRNAFIHDHQEAGSRIEKMEKALSEEMAKTREMDDILAGVVKRVGYVSEAPEGDFKAELLKWLDIEIAMTEENLEAINQHGGGIKPLIQFEAILLTYKAVKAHIQG